MSADGVGGKITQLPRLHSSSGEIAGCALLPCLQPAFGHASVDRVVCSLVAFRLQQGFKRQATVAEQRLFPDNAETVCVGLDNLQQARSNFVRLDDGAKRQSGAEDDGSATRTTCLALRSTLSMSLFVRHLSKKQRASPSVEPNGFA